MKAEGGRRKAEGKKPLSSPPHAPRPTPLLHPSSLIPHPCERARRLPPCPTFQALESAGSDVISLAWGVPATDLLPLAALAECTRAPFGEEALQYGDLLGNPGLRAVLQEYLAARGIAAPVGQIAVLTGGTLGIELFTRLLMGEDEAVILESPAFSEAIRIFRAYSDHLVPVPVDAHGLITGELEEAVARLIARRIRPKILYTVPHFQNPTGATLSLERRRQVLETAIRYDLTVLEDDPYFLMSFTKDTLPPLRALDGGNASVVYLDSFSKSLAPGLRIGWAVVPPRLLEPFKSLKQAVDFSPNPFAQEAAYRFCAGGHLEPHLARLRSAYFQRKEVLLRAVQRHLPEAAVRVDPDGGFFLWLDLPPDGPSTQDLLERALAAGTSFIPGPTLDLPPRSQRSLRLSFSYETPERLGEGVKRLAGIIRGN